MDEAGETSLAAATAAIIAARWTAAVRTGRPAANGGTGSSSHATSRHGTEVNGNGSDQSVYSPHSSHAAWAPPVAPQSFEPQSFEPQSFQHPTLPARPLERRVPSAPPEYDAPLAPPEETAPGHGRGEGSTTIGAAAASFFAAAHLESVPEVFGARVPMPRPAEELPPAPDTFSFSSVMGDLPFPEPFPAEALEPGFSTFAPADVAPADVAPADVAPSDFAPSDFAPSGDSVAVETNGHVPPGFERRSFGPYRDEARGNGFTSYEPGGFIAPPEPPPLADWSAVAPAPEDHQVRESREKPERSAVAVLPRRTPQIPDVPDLALFANDPLLDPSAPLADRQELTRIATYLRDDDDAGQPRPDGFDLNDVLEAVRGVTYVRDAHLRWNAEQGHTLRIEFVDDADPGEVTRQVVRLLREKMGLAAEPSSTPSARLSADETTLDRLAPRPRGGVVASARVPVRPPASGFNGSRSAPAGGRPLASSVDGGAARVVIDHVQVTNLGVDATVEVRLCLSVGGALVARADGSGQGPAVDAYLLRPAAAAAADAVNALLADGTAAPRGRCFVEHVAVVPFGVVEVAVVVVLLSHGSERHGAETDQLTGSAIVAGDPRQAVVRATLAALNRRLSALLS